MKKLLTIDKFSGGIVRDDRSRVIGAASNIEELDIFTNGDYIQAEQVMSADSMPASTEVFGYTSLDDDTYMIGYGKKATSNEVRLVAVAEGGTANPGAFSTLFTSSDNTIVASIVSDIKFFRSEEASNKTSVYYTAVSGGSTFYLKRYNFGAAAEHTWNGSAWDTTSNNSQSQLTGLNGTNSRPTMKVIYGSLYICNGQYIAEVNKDGVFTEKKFTLPPGYEAVDMIALSDSALILCRNKNINSNETKLFEWDLSSSTQFVDSITIPMGGPQWIYNHKEAIRVLCATNYKARLYQLNGSFPVETHQIDNVGLETSTQPISPTKSVTQKDGILYFGLYKTDKSGIYAIGQTSEASPAALILSKRFGTGDYATHKPTALLIHGPNYYCAYYDGSANVNSRCESANSPTRSSNAVYESVWIDSGEPFRNKDIERAFVKAYPLASSCSLALSVASDYSSSYTAVKRANDSVFNSANGILGLFKPAAFNNKKAFKVKVAFTSSTTNSPKLQHIGLLLKISDNYADQ